MLDLPRRVRLLRRAAMGLNVVIAFFPLLALFDGTRPNLGTWLFIGSFLLFGAGNIAVLASGAAVRLVFWGALLLNAAAAALFVLLSVTVPRQGAFMLLIAAPAVLNIVALAVVRRARTRVIARAAS